MDKNLPHHRKGGVNPTCCDWEAFVERGQTFLEYLLGMGENNSDHPGKMSKYFSFFHFEKELN